MIPSILQLAGAILLAIMTFLRKTSQIQMYANNSLIEMEGKVNPKFKDMLKETYLFRVGLIFICVGYLFQILALDLDFLLQLPFTRKLLATLVLTAILTLLGYIFCRLYSTHQFNKIPPFDPAKGPHAEGTVWIKE